MDSTQSIILTELAERMFPRRWPAYLKMLRLVNPPFDLPEHQESRIDRLAKQNAAERFTALRLDEGFLPIDRPALWGALQRTPLGERANYLRTWLKVEATTDLTQPLLARYRKYGARLAMTINQRVAEILISTGVTVFGRCAGPREQLKRADLLDAEIDIVGNAISKGGQKWHSVDIEAPAASSTSMSEPSAEDRTKVIVSLVNELDRRRGTGEPHTQVPMVSWLRYEFPHVPEREARKIYQSVDIKLRGTAPGRPRGSRNSIQN